MLFQDVSENRYSLRMGKRRRWSSDVRGESKALRVGQYVGLGLLAVATIVLVGTALRPADLPISSSELYTPTPRASSEPLPFVSIVGDSYVAGSEMNSGAEWPDLLGLPISLDVHGYSGVGYITTNPTASGDDTFATGAASVSPNAEVILFFGSRNDGEVDPTAAATAAWQTARDIAPEATLVVVGPAWVDANVPAGVLAYRDLLGAAAQAAGAQWIDPIAEGWFFDDASLIGVDGVHPTDAGHAYMAEKFKAILTPLIPAQS